ncbi:MAG: hypothetical protein FIB07_09070 [Candidatus Methanoperedens sp.]|nr:hypothetical protein [Candidatus Methanoperedens sp.]
MNFSLDTNIILGIVNTKDRIHEASIALMKDKRNAELFLCNSALKESHNVLRNKINEVMVEIIGFFRDIYQDVKIDYIESQARIIELFKKIKINKPGITNFLDLVFHEILLFLKEHNAEDLPSFLSQLSINLSASIVFKIKEIHPDFKIISLDLDHLSEIKKSLADIHFKDTNDERIFQELMTNLADIKPIEFFLDDLDFAKKCIKGFGKIANDMGFENEAFFSRLLRDHYPI